MYSFEVLKNRITVDIEDDLAKVKEFYKLNDIDLTFNTRVSNLKLPALKANGNDNGQIQYIAPFPQQKVPTIIFFNTNEYEQPKDGYITSNASTNTISLRVNEFDNNTDFIWKAVAHEIMHFIIRDKNKNGYLINDPMDYMLVKEGGKWVGKTYYKNDDPYAKDGNYAEAFKLLKSIKPMKKYRYFSDKEIIGLEPSFVKKLDDARHLAGFPFVIVSGHRTPEHNKKVGGKANSAHLRGYACDIKAETSEKRWKLIKACMDVGFNRFGVNKTTVHVDCDPSLPANMLWHYY